MIVTASHVQGNSIVVTNSDDWEVLVRLPGSLCGNYDPKRQLGQVFFDSQESAYLAWVTL